MRWDMKNRKTRESLLLLFLLLILYYITALYNITAGLWHISTTKDANTEMKGKTLCCSQKIKLKENWSSVEEKNRWFGNARKRQLFDVLKWEFLLEKTLDRILALPIFWSWRVSFFTLQRVSLCLCTFACQWRPHEHMTGCTCPHVRTVDKSFPTAQAACVPRRRLQNWVSCLRSFIPQGPVRGLGGQLARSQVFSSAPHGDKQHSSQLRSRHHF